jgi:hypothetical protein
MLATVGRTDALTADAGDESLETDGNVTVPAGLIAGADTSFAPVRGGLQAMSGQS